MNKSGLTFQFNLCAMCLGRFSIIFMYYIHVRCHSMYYNNWCEDFKDNQTFLTSLEFVYKK
jgi:hypothetical protein